MKRRLGGKEEREKKITYEAPAPRPAPATPFPAAVTMALAALLRPLDATLTVLLIPLETALRPLVK